MSETEETYKFIPARPVIDKKLKAVEKKKPVNEKPLEIIRLKRPLQENK